MRELWEIFKILAEKIKPYVEKFKIWFNQQEGMVKAAVIAILGTFVTGCFVLLAAIISRQAPTPVLIVTATAVPTLTPTPTPVLATTSISPTAPNDKLLTPPTPILEWLGNLSQNLSAEMTSLVLGALGVILIILGLWQAWLVFFNRTEKHKVAIFAIILVCIILFATWQQWGWMPILIAAGSIGLAPLLVGLMIDAILKVPYLGASIVGATIAFFLGIGNSLLYLAIPGPFISEYIEMASLIGITIGAILGLLLSSRYAGYWH